MVRSLHDDEMHAQADAIAPGLPSQSRLAGLGYGALIQRCGVTRGPISAHGPTLPSFV